MHCDYLQTTVAAANKIFIWHELHRPRPRININFVSNLTHITTTLKLARTYIYPFYIWLDHHTSYYWFFLIKPPPYLLLTADTHLTHQHEEKGTPPPQQHTCGRHLVQLRMTTRPQKQTIVTPSHPPDTNTARPSPFEPAQLTNNRYTMPTRLIHVFPPPVYTHALFFWKRDLIPPFLYPHWH